MSDDAKALVPEESVPLNEEEQKALDAFVAEFTPDEVQSVSKECLIRFIRGYWREQDRHKQTVENFKKTLEFRKEMDANNILNATLDKETEYFKIWPQDYHGVDKRGHPVYIEKTATVDPSTLLANFNVHELKRFHTQMQETLEWRKQQESERSGNMTYKQIVIMDMYDFGMKHCSSTFYDPLKAIIMIDQYYYPESLYKLYLINCPFVFRALWKVVKPWLHPLTAARIEILGVDFLPQLVKLIDEDQIPKYLGGKCECCTAEKLELQMPQKLEKIMKWRQERIALAEAKKAEKPAE
jgi:hypothetical protein